MCVIVAVTKKLPSLETLKSCQSANSHGAGYAWIAGKTIHYVREIQDIEQHYDHLKKLRLPILIHFRLASIGGIDPKLTHPFPIEEGVPLRRQGTTRIGVVAHNGNWTEFKEKAMLAILARGLKPLSEPVSDTRYIAWFLYYFGLDFASLIGEKLAILTPKGLKLYGQFYEDGGALYSNLSFRSSYTSSYTWNSSRGNQKRCPYVGQWELCETRSYTKCSYIAADCPYRGRNSHWGWGLEF